jgi:hypothetical protein
MGVLDYEAVDLAGVFVLAVVLELGSEELEPVDPRLTVAGPLGLKIIALVRNGQLIRLALLDRHIKLKQQVDQPARMTPLLQHELLGANQAPLLVDIDHQQHWLVVFRPGIDLALDEAEQQAVLLRDEPDCVGLAEVVVPDLALRGGAVDAGQLDEFPGFYFEDLVEAVLAF